MGAQGLAALGTTAEETAPFRPVDQDRAPGTDRRRPSHRRTPRRRYASRLPVAGYRLTLTLLDFTAAAGLSLVQAGVPARAVLTGAVLASLQAVAGGYRPRRSLSLVDEVMPTVARVLLADLAVNRVLLPPTPATLPHAALQMLEFVLSASVLALVGRLPVFRAARRFRRRPSRLRATVVIGSGTVADRVAQHLDRCSDLGLTVTARLDLRHLEGPLPASAAEDWPHLTRTLRAMRARVALVACEDVQPGQLDAAMRAAARTTGEVWAVVTTPGLLPAGARGREYLDGIPVVRVLDAARVTLGRRGKRMFDFVVASATAVLLGWLMVLCAVAVRLEGGPGVIFRQRRVGLLGREFTLVKFRTVRPSSEHHADTSWSVDDERLVGPVGRFLRKTSLDELPQLWNVVRGDMSLVGPRPERPHFVGRFGASVPNYGLRHRMPVGMTGWAQVNGLRGDTSIEDRVRYDNYYIDHWSFAADLRILLMTVRAVLVREGR
ncbi:exopolysaccharide biosynthesis polyprenyl glycosylphosphotransferase [Actinomadura oligospora]|uniref:exopolysaccharide biosynthesis polyprenyl glycosylphosphotransferase n=1 Tax=Actinomadura oligospora TaxID=111804 RepID=UPI0006849A1A|nr:exopolysaccharide biosynthesis polyprenyl glycosylphosphotransferase [Actinomadura oligospora]